MSQPDSTFNLKEVMEFLLNNFKLERYVYLAVTILSIILLSIIVIILLKNQDYTNILVMLGPTGLITFSFSRVLKMWSDCIDLIETFSSK